MIKPLLCIFQIKNDIEEDNSEEELELENNRDKLSLNSWYYELENNNNLKSKKGPNINLKYFKKKYVTDEEKHFITKKIRSKKKTELCKNWEIYHDCYFKNECSYAHGLDELRTDTPVSGSKNRLCKSFQEKGFCLFGKRCNYRHVIKEERLFTYNSIVNDICNDLFNEMNKAENKEVSILKIYKRLLLNKRLIM